MAAKCKQAIRKRYILAVISLVFLIVTVSYLWVKTRNILYKSQSWIDFAWLDYLPSFTDIFQPSKPKGSLTIFQGSFYGQLWLSVLEDAQYVNDLIYHFIVYICEIFSSVLAIVALIVLVCVLLSVSLYKESRTARKSKSRGNEKKVKGKTQNGHVCCDHQSRGYRGNKLWWKWLTLLVFLAMLLSIPWEFIHMYQSMVAEKVAQMQAGIPPECLPDQTLLQSIKSYLRWYFSWGKDPCLVYHKALIVDPLWQVPPLMVLSSAFSHCIVYPVEVLFGSLGRAFRLFFSEIPAPWQPFMLVVMVILIVLTLIMAFGYRIDLPMLLKFEPKTPICERQRTCRGDTVKKESQNLQYTETESQQSITSSQESQSQFSQAMPDFD